MVPLWDHIMLLRKVIRFIQNVAVCTICQDSITSVCQQRHDNNPCHVSKFLRIRRLRGAHTQLGNALIRQKGIKLNASSGMTMIPKKKMYWYKTTLHSFLIQLVFDLACFITSATPGTCIHQNLGMSLHLTQFQRGYFI